MITSVVEYSRLPATFSGYFSLVNVRIKCSLRDVCILQCTRCGVSKYFGRCPNAALELNILSSMKINSLQGEAFMLCILACNSRVCSKCMCCHLPDTDHDVPAYSIQADDCN